MMQTLRLLLVMDVQAPPGGSLGPDLDARIETVVVPLLELLEDHAEIRCTLHISGQLVQRIQATRPPEIGRIRALLKRKRVELLGSGFFDPLLVAIPERDATGQIQLMNGVLGEQFDIKPAGVWLTGRAWDPALPGLLNRAGFQYTLADEAHFLATELEQDDLDGYHITEREGFPLAVFPIRTELQRQLMAAEPGQRSDVLQRFLDGHEQRSALLAFDNLDGPDAMAALTALVAELAEQRHWIKTRTCGEYLDKERPAGRVYLPSVIRAEGLDDTFEGLGWVRFLVEYPEAVAAGLHPAVAGATPQRLLARRTAARGL